MPTLNLPVAGRGIAPYTTRLPRKFPPAKPPFNRIAYAAAHVVADPFADADPWLDAAIDWEGTVAFRRHLWSLGLGVAEAMDTAQGMGLDWPSARAQAYDGVAATLEYARGHALPLVEPLHSIERAERSCINTLSYALTSAMPSTPAAPARSAWRAMSITPGGTRSWRRRSNAQGASGYSPITCATGWCRPLIY